MPQAWHPGQLLFTGFEGTQLPPDLAELIAGGRIGGVVLFSRNVRDPEQLQRLADALHEPAPAGLPLCVAIDQEGGRVQRLREPWTEWPPMRRVGAHDRSEETRALGRALARELADLRIDLDFAPVVDVDTNPDNPVIGDRSFASTPEAVARHGIALIEGLQAEGVAACAKHFPGHGDTHLDSHLALPRIDHDLGRLREIELPPFRAAAEAGVASMMTAHVVVSQLDPALPATLSRAALDLLRDEIGYDGLVFGDDFEMAAIADHFALQDSVRRALEAGCDALLVGRSRAVRDEILSALETLPDRLLEAPARRMAAFKEHHAGGRRVRPGGPPYAEHAKLRERLLA
jgi:beta-N-acetylhexosaminidase